MLLFLRAKSFALLCLLSLAVTGAFGATTLLLDLEEMHGAAAFVFYGRCVANRAGEDPETGIPAIFTTFAVQRPLKGEITDFHTIKQLGGAGAEDLSVAAGMPRFAVGRRYVVFLTAPSELGFSSPIGLHQGVFRVLSRSRGEVQVSNGRQFASLLEYVDRRKLPDRVLQKLGWDGGYERGGRDRVGSRLELKGFLEIVRRMEVEQ